MSLRSWKARRTMVVRATSPKVPMCGRLADSSLFARDPAAFDQAAARLAAARTELSHAEEQWLEIEMKRESLEG